MKYFFIGESYVDPDEDTLELPVEKTIYGPYDDDETASRVRFRLYEEDVHDWFSDVFGANIAGPLLRVE